MTCVITILKQKSFSTVLIDISKQFLVCSKIFPQLLANTDLILRYYILNYFFFFCKFVKSQTIRKHA